MDMRGIVWYDPVNDDISHISRLMRTCFGNQNAQVLSLEFLARTPIQCTSNTAKINSRQKTQRIRGERLRIHMRPMSLTLGVHDNDIVGGTTKAHRNEVKRETIHRLSYYYTGFTSFTFHNECACIFILILEHARSDRKTINVSHTSRRSYGVFVSSLMMISCILENLLCY